MMNVDYSRTCFRDLGTTTFDTGNSQCQALGGHLPVVTKSATMTFLANKLGQYWMSLKTDRLVISNNFLVRLYRSLLTSLQATQWHNH
jgi:hypothetical protein